MLHLIAVRRYRLRGLAPVLDSRESAVVRHQPQLVRRPPSGEYSPERLWTVGEADMSNEEHSRQLALRDLLFRLKHLDDTGILSPKKSAAQAGNLGRDATRVS